MKNLKHTQMFNHLKIAVMHTVVWVCSIVLMPSDIFSQCAGSGTSPMTLTSAGACTWTAPAGVTEITVQVWGAGGGGGGGPARESYINGGGGGGGAYSTGTFTVIPGFVYSVFVGSGGSAGIEEGADGGDGTNTWFSNIGAKPRTAAEGLLAEGGKGGETGPNVKPDGGTTKGLGGAGGAAANGFGNLHKNSGGDGGDSQYRWTGAGGGSSAGTASGSNGVAGSDDIDDNTTRSGGTAPAGGGDGGSSHRVDGAIAGTVPGGGGGGSDAGGDGAAGANGKIIITWAVGCTQPVITTQPSHVSQEVCNGAAPTDLFIVATAAGTPTYQWYSNTTSSNIGGSLIGGATTDTYTPPTGSDGTTYYYVVVTDAGCSITSNISGAVIVYSGVPTISTNPLDQTVIAYNGIGEFEVVASGGAMTYQWQESTDGGTTWSNITDGGVYSGATSTTLLITDPPFWMSGYVYKDVISSCTDLTTATATLTVNNIAETAPCEGSTKTYGVAIPSYNTDVPAGNDVTYEWSYPTTNGWSLSSGGTSTDNEITLVVGTSTETVSVRFVGPCADNGPWRSVTVNPVSAIGVWTGEVDKNWNENGNWCGVPACASLDATIPTDPTGGKFPEISADGADCRNLTIETGAYLTTTSTYTLGVCGDWSNNGTYVPNTGAIHFIGTTTEQDLGGTGTQTFYDLVINNSGASGSDNITLSQPITVSNVLTLTDGILNTDATNLLTLTNTSTTATTGGNSSGPSFVDGPIRWNGLNGAGPFIFPTGDGANNWGRVSIEDVTASTDFTCQYFFTSHSNVGPGDLAASPTPVLNNVSSTEYWDVNRTSGAGNAALKLYWEDNTASDINSCPTDGDLVVAHYTGGKWENANSSTTVTVSGSCGTNEAGTVKSDVMTTFSPFTFGSISLTYNPLPVELISFNAIYNGESVELTWETATEISNDYFTIERSTDGINFILIEDFIPSKSNGGHSTSHLSYQKNDEDVNAGTYYYRLKQTDFNGMFQYSKMEMVEILDANNFIFTVSPNPNEGYKITIQVKTKRPQNISLTLHDALGQRLSSKSIDTQANENFVFNFNFPEKLTPGLYIITLSSNQKTQSKRLIIK